MQVVIGLYLLIGAIAAIWFFVSCLVDSRKDLGQVWIESMLESLTLAIYGLFAWPLMIPLEILVRISPWFTEKKVENQ